jgi:hypothetical protein
VTLPVSSGGVGLIFSEVIVLVIYVGSWAFITTIIVFKFLLNFHLFLLKSIGVSSSKIFPF